MSAPPHEDACHFCGFHADGWYDLRDGPWRVCDTCRTIAAAGRLDPAKRVRLEQRVIGVNERGGRTITPAFRRRVKETVAAFFEALEQEGLAKPQLES